MSHEFKIGDKVYYVVGDYRSEERKVITENSKCSECGHHAYVEKTEKRNGWGKRIVEVEITGLYKDGKYICDASYTRGSDYGDYEVEDIEIIESKVYSSREAAEADNNMEVDWGDWSVASWRFGANTAPAANV